MHFEVIHKPTFTNQLLAIPKEQIVHILEKVEYLRTNPTPDGKLKKKLTGYKGNVYRLRSGDYRIIYSYGDGYVALLGVDRRAEVYRGEQTAPDDVTLDLHTLPNLDDALSPPDPRPSTSVPAPNAKAELLPVKLETALLTKLLVPEECFPQLRKCKTLDDLLQAQVPEGVRERIFDCITSPDYDRVLAQPSFLTGETDNLLKFAEGELLGFLLKLDTEQERFVTWGLKAKGPTLLKGGPGTGKSLVALYRVGEYLKALKKSGVEKPHILFTTYTTALIAVSRQLLKSLLGTDATAVEVRTADSVVLSIVNRADGSPQIATQTDLRKLLKTSLPQAKANLSGNVLQRQAQEQTLDRLSADYLLEEILHVIEARGLDSLAAYQAATRSGRVIPLNKTQRMAVWSAREWLMTAIAEAGLTTWPHLRNRAVAILNAQAETGRYDAVVIDEAQDLDLNVLNLLVRLAKAPNRLFLTADSNQSIYGTGLRWSDVHECLQFTGRTGVLKLNYRSTREIGDAARSYLHGSEIDAEGTDFGYLHQGPPPAVRAVATALDESELLIRFCRAAAREFRLGVNSCAVLTPTEAAGKAIAGRLSHLGLKTAFMTGKELDLNQPGVKVLTLKSAKGLEFPIVALAGFLEAPFPPVQKGATAEEQAEMVVRERRTMFVGMTRAMRALLVVVPVQTASPLLQNFAPGDWNLGESTP